MFIISHYDNFFWENCVQYLNVIYINRYGFSITVQRIFQYGDVQNTTFTPDNEPNTLIYRTHFCVIIYI